MKVNQLKQLIAVTETALAAAQASMARMQLLEADLRQQLIELKGTNAMGLSESAATRAGADVRWNRWVDKRREDINTELARTLAEKESVREKLRIAFGKDQAVRKLSSKQDAALRIRRQKQI